MRAHSGVALLGEFGGATRATTPPDIRVPDNVSVIRSAAARFAYNTLHMMPPDSVDAVDTDTFRAAIRPTLTVLLELATAVNAVVPATGICRRAHHGQCGDFAAEVDVRDPHAVEQSACGSAQFGRYDAVCSIRHTQSFAGVGLSPPHAVYGHLVLARAALESCVVAAWLNEPDIAVAARVKRGLCEHLYSASELVRLGLEPDAGQRLERWKATADGFGWTWRFERGKPVVDARVARPFRPG